MNDDLEQLTCDQCGGTFARRKRPKEQERKHQRTYCSKRCQDEGMMRHATIPCAWCEKPVTRRSKHIRMDKSVHVFCNHSCAASYNNRHKTKGTRRSTLERWMESELRSRYPDLDIVFNGKDAIGSELDILFPSLCLAFELNGIFHYEPVFGQPKLDSVRDNDRRKFAACHEKGIGLCVIDVSTMKRFTEHRATEYLRIVTRIADEAINASSAYDRDPAQE